MATLVKEYFNWLAAMYDETTAACAWSAPGHIANAALPLLHAGQAVLDLGCGTGQSLAPFVDHGCRCIGLDFAPAMLAEAHRKVPQALLARADLDEPRGWPVRERAFDLAISAGVYECLDDPVGFLARVRTHLRPGGALVFTFDEFVPGHPAQGVRVGRADSGIPNPIAELTGWHLRRHSIDRVGAWLEANGFVLHWHHQIEADIHSHFQVPVYYRLVVAQATD
ncbi:MAG: class I SAM-dependent methyltransferase [Fimbriimonadaceae bacterium]|nr:class I SAM-dependent methyltransferase [Fimbriimonadaceae bacterium]